jgi:hypothetical protein
LLSPSLPSSFWVTATAISRLAEELRPAPMGRSP